MSYGYVRVSSQDQYDNGQSLKAQQEIIQDWYNRHAAKEKWDGLRIYIDGGVSAFKKNLPDRPEGRRLLGALQKGDTVVFTKLDRAFRNIADGNQTLKWLQSKNMRAIFLDMGGTVIDITTPVGFISINSMLLGAQFESVQKSDRMRSTWAHLKKTRGFAAHCLPGHDSYRTGTRTIVQKQSQQQIDMAKYFLTLLFVHGKAEAVKAIGDGRIQFIKRMANGRKITTDYTRADGPIYFLKQTYIKACQILYYTKTLIDFAKSIGVDPAQMIDPANERYRSPMSGRWHQTRFPTWDQHYDLSGTAS